MTVGDFKAAIKERGLSQREAAIALGVTEATVSRWCNGRNRIPDIVSIALRAVPKAKKPAA
jgi:transcriptional regulator with XRE-family HTH domain